MGTLVDWSRGLPRDLLASILQRLPLRDWIRSGAVCVTWRSLVTERGYPPQLPWLILNNTFNFYSLSDKIEYKIHLPIYSRSAIAGSEGWLIIFKNARNDVFLLNPLTRAQIQLPSKTTLPDGSSIIRVVVSWSSASSYTVLVVVALCATIMKKFAFARAGDEAWTTLENVYDVIGNIVPHKGLFYFCSDTKVEVLDFTGPTPKFTLVAGNIRDGDETGSFYSYLVESSGDLFLLVEQFIQEGAFYLKTCGFKVFKLDTSGLEWIEAKTFGSYAFFVGLDLPLSLPTHDFPGLKGSCIYLIPDGSLNSPYLWMFDLDDERVKKYYPHELHLTSIDRWFVPNLL